MKAHAFGRAVTYGDEYRHLTVLEGERRRVVSPPNFIRLLGDDRAGVGTTLAAVVPPGRPLIRSSRSRLARKARPTLGTSDSCFFRSPAPAIEASPGEEFATPDCCSSRYESFQWQALLLLGRQPAAARGDSKACKRPRA